MKRGSLSAGLFGALMVLAGFDQIAPGEPPVMVEKVNRNDKGKAGRSPSMPMARNPAAAVAEEYEAARRKGTREAFELFIARHADDPLAEQARSELRRFSR